MAEKNTANIGFEKQIWDAACVLWGHIPAAEYRKVIVGLIFLRYISSAFEKRYNELVAEGDGFEDEPDAYLMDNIFFVPEKARWSVVSAAAHTPEIGSVIDDAMRAIEEENKTLKNVLPKNYASPDLDKRVLGDVVDLFTNMDMTDTEDSKDLLGRTYEYCIAQFAAYEGVKGGEFYTPSSVVRTLVEILRPFENCRVYDPCCGSGGMFVQSAKFIQAHSGNRGNISVYGQESNADTWKMAKMNMAIRGIDADFGQYHADTFFNDLHKTLKADFIMANPPFNLSNWGQDKLKDDIRWKYGVPPAGNANYAWIQHMIHHLAPNGKIGLVLANAALTISNGSEYEIKKNIIEDDLVECIISLPAHLFYSTKIKVSLWIISKKKKQPNTTLFIDGRKLGSMTSRTIRELLDADIDKISHTYQSYINDDEYSDETAFCYKATLDEIKKKNYNISPTKYVVGSLDADEISDWADEKEYDIKRLMELQEQSRAINSEISDILGATNANMALFDSVSIPDILSISTEDVKRLINLKQSKSDLAKEIDATVKKTLDEIFKYWFIDYNFQNENGLPYSETDGIMQETECGLIPQGWSVRKMGDFLTESKEKVGERLDIPEFSTTNRGVYPRSEKFNKQLSNNSSKNKVIYRGCIIFGMSREIFNFGVMKDSIGSVSPAYHVYKIDDSIINPVFLELLMRNCPDYFLSLIKPGAREGQVLDKEELSKKLIVVPTLEVQNKYVLLHNYLNDFICYPVPV